MARSELDFSFRQAALVSLFIESILFGAFSVTYALALWVLLHRVRQRHGHLSRANAALVATSTLMYILAVTHIGLEFVSAAQHLVPTKGSGASMTSVNTRDLMGIIEIAIVATMAMVADAFMMYRAYVVWNHNKWIIVLPLILIVATGASAYTLCGLLLSVDPTVIAQARSATDNMYHGGFAHWIQAIFFLTLLGHLYSSLLVAGRLIWANYKLRKHGALVIGVSLWDVLETIIQSSAVHSVALICLLVAFLTCHNAWIVIIDILVPLLGTMFTLLVIRVGLGYKNAVDELRESMPHGEAGYGVNRHSTWLAREDLRIQPIEVAVSVAHTHDSLTVPLTAALSPERSSSYTDRDVLEIKDWKTGL